MLASQLQVGYIVLGLGRIHSLNVNLGDKAVMRNTNTWGIEIRPAMRVNGLLRSRLAQEALEHSYERVPVSITVVSGDERRVFDINEEVEIEIELMAAA
jgi:hypothetical protein